MSEFTADDLKAFQSEPLFPSKYQRSLAKISEAYSVCNDRIVVSFSGGKDSSVLADMAAFWCKVKGCTLNLAFVNTGLEYPEIQRHVTEFKSYLEGKHNIDVNLAQLKPKMRFDEVISTYGYPLIGKEVAEAIYYARRIRSQNSKVERERESKRGEFKACRDIDSEKPQNSPPRTDARSRGNAEWQDWRRRCL